MYKWSTVIPVFRLRACVIYVHELKIKLLKSKFECCLVFSCSRPVVLWNSDEFQSY